MFAKIMVPVDLRHSSELNKALAVSAELSKIHNATVVYVGVTSPEPSELGHNPGEYKQKLEQFAQAQATQYGHSALTHMIVSNDPSVDLDKALVKASKDIDADLVVMATHIPNFTDYIWSSHGGYLANHAKSSVFLVRQ